MKRILSLITGFILGFYLVKRISKIDQTTIRFRREYNQSLYLFLHGYIYGRYQRIYLRLIDLIGDLLLKFGFKKSPAHNRLRDTHHCKVVSLEEAKKIIVLDEPIVIKNPETVVPFKKARDIILENPRDIAVLNCACRKLNKDGCKPDEVCLYLGKTLVDFVIKHDTWGARRIDIDKALKILEQGRKNGNIQTIWFKDAFGDRLYSICSCCSCCCLGLKAYRQHGIPLISSSGYLSEVDHVICNNCGNCLQVCHFEAIKEIKGQIIVNPELCLGCGLCHDICPQEAISLKTDSSKPQPVSRLL